ncbi:MAG: hypothetical protein RR865_12950 [Clostridia bacterium]
MLFKNKLDEQGNQLSSFAMFPFANKQAREEMVKGIDRDVTLMQKYKEEFKANPEKRSDIWNAHMLNASQSAKDFMNNPDDPSGHSTDEYRKQQMDKLDTKKGFSGVKKALKGFGMGLLQNVLNAGAWALAAAAVNAFYEQVIMGNQRAIEASDELVARWKEENAELADKKKVATDSSDEFERLQKGINAADGSNLSLSTTEFERYHELANQVADTFPALVSGWDSEGNAILRVTGKLIDLNAEYEKAAQGQRSTIIGEMGTNVDGVVAEYNQDSDPYKIKEKELTDKLTVAKKIDEYVTNGKKEGLADLFYNYGSDRKGRETASGTPYIVGLEGQPFAALGISIPKDYASAENLAGEYITNPDMAIDMVAGLEQELNALTTGREQQVGAITGNQKQMARKQKYRLRQRQDLQRYRR